MPIREIDTIFFLYLGVTYEHQLSMTFDIIWCQIGCIGSVVMKKSYKAKYTRRQHKENMANVEATKGNFKM